jgi:hypothetical protein
MVILDGHAKVEPAGITVFIPAGSYSLDMACLQQWDKCRVGFLDNRDKSYDQIRIAWALMTEIGAHVCQHKDAVYEDQKMFFNAYMDNLYGEMHETLKGLSKASMTVAREFVDYLISFCIRQDIPTSIPLYDKCNDIETYVYMCLMHKKCAVCNKQPVDLHHFDQIGMGNSRVDKYQIGMCVISLCREHHGMCDTKGRTWLTDDLHLVPIPLTAEIGKVYGLTKRNLQKE